MARIKARIKPRPVVAQSRSDAKLKRAEARALAAEAEEREFARKEAAEDDALLATQERKDWAEYQREVTKEFVDQHLKFNSDRKALNEKIKEEDMRTDEKKLEKLFEDQKEEARVQKAVDDAAEKDAVFSISALTAAVIAHLSAFTAAVDAAAVDAHISAFTAAVDALRTTYEEQARNRQEAASKKESGYKDAVDAIRRASLERTLYYAKEDAKVDAEEAALFRRELDRS
jgi:hypothetical protein